MFYCTTLIPGMYFLHMECLLLLLLTKATVERSPLRGGVWGGDQNKVYLVGILPKQGAGAG